MLIIVIQYYFAVTIAMLLIERLAVCYQQGYNLRTKLLNQIPDSTGTHQLLSDQTSEQIAALILFVISKERKGKIYRTQLRVSCPEDGRVYFVGISNRPRYVRAGYIHSVSCGWLAWEYVWPIGLTNDQLTTGRIAQALWRADTLNLLKEASGAMYMHHRYLSNTW